VIRVGFHRALAQRRNRPYAILRRKMTRYSFCLVIAVGFLCCPAGAQAQLFESRSKRSERDKMDIAVREIERRDRSSLLEITINAVGSSVGASFFLLCSIRNLALERGNYRYIAKIEARPKHGQMIIGFLRDPKEELSGVAPEFQALADQAMVIDLEQFAPLCAAMR
jgi:hypothetical protein